jgi:hypothetical protein
MPPPFARKYRNKPMPYNGVTYHSTGEARHAMGLDLRVRAGEIRGWIRQVPIALGDPINRIVVDFLVVGNDGRCHAEEYKGAWTPKFTRDVKLWRKYGLMPLHIIGGKKLEIIIPDGRGQE